MNVYYVLIYELVQMHLYLQVWINELDRPLLKYFKVDKMKIAGYSYDIY